MTVRVDIDRERLAEMRERESFFRGAADKVNEAARRIVERGDGWGQRKAFISDVAAEVGSTVRRLAPLLVHWNNLGWVELARADLIYAMPFEKVQASHINLDGFSDYHFIVVPDARKAKRNPSLPKLDQKGLEKYREFSRLDPDEAICEEDQFMPERAARVGKALHVMYRSAKIDPDTDKRPRGGAQNYIHEHDAGVHVYDPDPDGEIGHGDLEDVPECDPNTTLVLLGQCLGLAWKSDVDDEEYECEWDDRDVELYCTTSGKMLVIVGGKREILYLIWGGALGVEPRGIVG